MHILEWYEYTDCTLDSSINTNSKYFEKGQDHFVYANYRNNTGKCSAYYIRAVVVEDLVWQHMKTMISYVSCHEGYFRIAIEERLKLS